jgi:hypothetical protein
LRTEEVRLEEARLEEARLEGAGLEGAGLEGARLEEARLEEAGLEGARLEAGKRSLDRMDKSGGTSRFSRNRTIVSFEGDYATMSRSQTCATTQPRAAALHFRVLWGTPGWRRAESQPRAATLQ